VLPAAQAELAVGHCEFVEDTAQRACLPASSRNRDCDGLGFRALAEPLGDEPDGA
jgi:hypothetical protein